MTLRPHGYGSFSYKTINERIQKILTERSKPENNVQVSMPFVKVTSTVEIPEILGPGAIGFTVGPHAMPDSGYESLYDLQSTKEAPVIGYTYVTDQEGKISNRKVYAESQSQTDARFTRFFSNNRPLQDTRDTYNRTPPPGITSIKIGRNRSGLSVTATIDIQVPTLTQLEYLNKVFLIPGCGMIVEWGQQFAPETNESLGEMGLMDERDNQGNITKTMRDKMFPWYDSAKRGAILQRLAKRQFGLQEILDKYVYPTQGQYMWMFGRVANIAVKGGSDGAYDVTVTLKGPSEDQWAYSVRRTVTPAFSQPNVICADAANSVEDYLTKTTPGGYNFKTLLDGVETGTLLPNWKGHVVKLVPKNKSDGVAGQGSPPNVKQSNFGDSQDAYFISWKFFVNVVLNGKEIESTGGIRGIYERAKVAPEVLEKMGFIRPYIDKAVQGLDSWDPYKNTLTTEGTMPADDPYESYVGNNKYLRSTDPGTMIIVNEYAAEEASKEFSGMGTSGQELQRLTNDKSNSDKMLAKLQFTINPAVGMDVDTVDKGLLSTGVWINHKAVIRCLVGADTVLQGISNLLNDMSAATKGFWALSLDTLDPQPNSPARYDYTVIDKNYRGNSAEAVSTALQNMYEFNKMLRISPEGKVVGSELTEFSVDLDLPKLLFSQIATMGLNERDDASVLGTANQSIVQCQSSAISDPSDTLRRMFGVTTASPKKNFASVDVTNRTPTPPAATSCKAVSAPVVPGGTFTQVFQSPVEITTTDNPALKAQQEEAVALQNELGGKNKATLFCVECDPCFANGSVFNRGGVKDKVVVDGTGGIPGGGGNPTANGSVAAFDNGRVTISPEFMTVINPGGATPETDRTTKVRYFTPLEGAQLKNGRRFTNNYDGKFWLEKEAAEQWMLMARAINNDPNAPTLSVTSAYRTYDHQQFLYETKDGGVAAPGTSPHGVGRAIDISELNNSANSISAEGNARCRETPLFKYLDRIGPRYGWWNPWRLRDGSGTEECWHWEYWGYREQITRPTSPTTTSCTDEGFAAITKGYLQKLDKEEVYKNYNDAGMTAVMRNAEDARPGLPGGPYRSALAPLGSIRARVTDTRAEIRDDAYSTLSAAQKEGAANIGKEICKQAEARCRPLADALAPILADLARGAAATELLETTVRDTENYNAILRYQELIPDYMVARIRCSADGNKANAFGASPGSLSIKADLTLPGIAGLRVGELFWIDKIPAPYKIFGAFQVMSVEDTIGVDGWQSRISAQFNFLGNQWKNKVLDIISPQQTSTATTVAPR